LLTDEADREQRRQRTQQEMAEQYRREVEASPRAGGGIMAVIGFVIYSA
jgi:predicted RNA-binding protein with TRAM domain